MAILSNPAAVSTPANASPERRSAIRDRLLAFAATIPAEDLTPALVPEAAAFVKQDPFAFILAVALDRGTKAEIIWSIPFWLREDFGHLDAARTSRMSVEELAAAIDRLPKKPRYVRDAPRTILDLAKIVAGELAGDAEAIWRGRTAHQVQMLLRRLYGVGEGIASMGVILLARCRGVRFPDWSAMNVKPDAHVRRVLYRLGVAARSNEADAVDAAARLNPEYPGALDPALWVIGRTWCREKGPRCAECVMSGLCARVGV